MKKSTYKKLSRMMMVEFTQKTPFGGIEMIALYDSQAIPDEEAEKLIEKGPEDALALYYTYKWFGNEILVMPKITYSALFKPCRTEQMYEDRPYKHQIYGCYVDGVPHMCSECELKEKCYKGYNQKYLNLEALYKMYKNTSTRLLASSDRALSVYKIDCLEKLNLIDKAIEERLKNDIIEDCSKYQKEKE